ncbi:MAG: extracellular solute-binding protein [Ruminococcaceae bacterium]|nr:extracellular solute-binding protein [Oscillospiraceae bacterium]
MTKKRIVSAALAGMMVLSSLSILSSCDGKDDGPTKTKRTNVYKGTEVPLPDGINYIDNLLVGGDKIYLFYSKEVERPWDPELDGEVVEEGVLPDIAVPYGAAAAATSSLAVMLPVTEAAEEEAAVEENIAEDDIAVEEPVVEEPVNEVYYDYISCLCTMNPDGTDMREYELEINGNSYISSMCVDPTGTLWIMEQEWWSNEDYTESGTFYSVYPFDLETGTAAYNLDLNIMIEESGLVEEGGYYYVNRFYVDGNGKLHFSLENGIITCDAKTGEVTGKCAIEDGWMSGMMISGDRVYVSVYENNSSAYAVYSYDPTASELQKVESAVLSEVMANMYNTDGVYPEGKIYLRDASGIKVYDFATDTAAELLNYINCDIDSSNMNSVCYTADGRVVSSYTDWNEGEGKSYCIVYERIPDEEMAEEVIITIAATYNDYNLRRAVIRFNKRNTGVRIAINSYDSYNNQENEWTGAVTQLNADLVSGKVPDILMIDSELPAESYFRQNMFADLNKYIDGENGLDRATLLDNILRASEQNGKLYSIIPSFYLYTLAAKPEYVGTEPGWTLEEMMNTINTMPEGMNAFFEYSRDQVMENMLRYSMDSFINWETGETYFDTEGFIDFIEYLKTLPEKGYWEAYYENTQEYDPQIEMQMQEDFDLRFYKDIALFSMQYISNFNGFTNAVRSFATDDVTLIGYPTREEGSNGATIIPEMELAVCSASDCKDEAWAFLKWLLTDEEYLDNLYSFTLNKEKLEELRAQAEEENEYYWEMTEDDYAWYYDNYSEEYVTYLKNSQRKYTPEDGARVMELLGGLTRIARTDSKVTDIITEELSGFFGGTKTAEQTADVINNRVRTYVSENS